MKTTALYYMHTTIEEKVASHEVPAASLLAQGANFGSS